MSPRGESAEDDVISRAVVACQRGDLKELDQLLEQDGVNASSSDTDGCSLLHWAAINNRVPIVQRLLSLGADPNVLGGILQSSALHWAARVGNLASCAVLIKAGAVANVRDTQGYTPIHLAVQGQHNNLVAYLLEKFDYAANITDNSGMTPTMWSAYRSFTIFPLRLILRKMADIDAKEHLQGNTALHLAAQERNYTAVIELVEGGADVSVKNKQHETAMDIARNNRNQRIIAMLEEGARRQGLQSQSCFHRLKRFRKVGQFVLPGCVLSLAGLLFYLFHYGIASMLVLILIIVIGCTVQIDMHGSHASLIPIGITVAEPCVMIVTWSFQVHWFAPWWLQISFFCIMFVLFLSLARLYFGDPGVVAPSLTADSFVTAVESLTPRLNYCFTCWVDRSDGSKHCAVCNRCVRGFDHHCPWLHNCVTKRNLRDFVIFVFCVAASSVVYSGAVIHLSATIVRDYSLDHLLLRHCFLIITALLAMFHAFALSMLFFQQCYQISSRVTTHDLIQRRRGHAPSYPTQDDVTDSTTSSSHSHSHSPFRMHGNVSLSERVRNIFEFCSGKY